MKISEDMLRQLEHTNALTARLLALKCWTVQPGMIDIGERVVRHADAVGGEQWWWDGFGVARPLRHFRPNIYHPSVMGWLAKWWREAHRLAEWGTVPWNPELLIEQLERVEASS